MKKNNLIYLLYLFPLLLVAVSVYAVFYLWERLSIFYIVFAIIAIAFAVLIMASNILRAIYSPMGFLNKNDKLEIVLFAETKKMDDSVTFDEIKIFLSKANGDYKKISSKNIERARVNTLVKEFFNQRKRSYKA